MYVRKYDYIITGGVYSSAISASDADGFYNTVTYSIDNDHGGIFTIDSSTGELSRPNNESAPVPEAVSNRINHKLTFRSA